MILVWQRLCELYYPEVAKRASQYENCYVGLAGPKVLGASRTPCYLLSFWIRIKERSVGRTGGVVDFNTFCAGYDMEVGGDMALSTQDEAGASDELAAALGGYQHDDSLGLPLECAVTDRLRGTQMWRDGGQYRQRPNPGRVQDGAPEHEPPELATRGRG